MSEERYSYPLFSTVDYDTVIGPLLRLVAPGRSRGRPRSRAVLPAGSLALSSFGQEARQRKA